MLPLTVLIITFVALFTVNAMEPVDVCTCRIVRTNQYHRMKGSKEIMVKQRRCVKMCDRCKKGGSCHRRDLTK